MKKLGVIVSLVFVSLLLVSSFVSAQPEILKPIAENAKLFYSTIFEPFGKFLLGVNTIDGELFFAKLLFFIILITLVNYALSQFEPLKKMAWIVSAIVSILAVRYITPAWIETIVLPYTALGIALTAFFPFVLFFFFVEKGLQGHTVMRKVAWIFATVVFVGLFLYRDTAQFPVSLGGFNPAYIYLITAGLCLIMLIADKTIEKAFSNVRVSNMMDKHKYSVEYDTTVAYQKIMDEYSASVTPEVLKPGANSRITTINQKRASVSLPGFTLIP